MNIIDRERNMKLEAADEAIKQTFRDWGMKIAWELSRACAIAVVDATGKAAAASSRLIDDDRGDICD